MSISIKKEKEKRKGKKKRKKEKENEQIIQMEGDKIMMNSISSILFLIQRG
jgi:hypothetical protein